MSICIAVLRFLIPFALLNAAMSARGEDGQSGAYPDDPKIIEGLESLPAGSSLLLPPVKHLRNGQEIDGRGRQGPYARDYTNKMVWAPDRQTALYAGGNHGAGRTNDVWEYHLGSNTWHNLFAAEGGDHARFKWSLMFAARIYNKKPEYEKSEREQNEWEACRQWWKENVALKDGLYVTHSGGPLLTGHTWDTLVYDPITRRMIHGTGAYCAAAAFVEHKFNGRPLEEVEAQLGTNAEGVPYRTMWSFDPESGKWSPYASKDELAELRGMGASMTYIPEWRKVVYYVAAQNVSPHAAYMRTWDPAEDKWEELQPNGRSVGKLAFTEKLAPTSEQQMAYSSRHRKLVAVLKEATYAYDIDKNEWSRLNETVPFTAHDAKTVFAYDSAADVFLLADPREGRLAAFDLVSNQWETITPDGPGIPKPPYCTGKGYYDPARNVFVVQSASQDRVWVYRHQQTK